VLTFLKPLLKLLTRHHQRPRAWAHVRMVVKVDVHRIAAVLYLQLVLLANRKPAPTVVAVSPINVRVSVLMV
jgi:hypothetical protein